MRGTTELQHAKVRKFAKRYQLHLVLKSERLGCQAHRAHFCVQFTESRKKICTCDRKSYCFLRNQVTCSHCALCWNSAEFTKISYIEKLYVLCAQHFGGRRFLIPNFWFGTWEWKLLNLKTWWSRVSDSLCSTGQTSQNSKYRNMFCPATATCFWHRTLKVPVRSLKNHCVSIVWCAFLQAVPPKNYR